MSGLLGGVLPAIYSQADRAKRYLGGLLSDPVGRMQQAGGQAVDDLSKIGLLSEQAFNDPKNPMKMQDNASSRQLVDTYLSSVLNFAPVGMTVKGPQAEALEKARKNAVKMLGLPENNTPMDRAKALGFIDRNAYHGTVEDVPFFDPRKFGQATGAPSAKQGVFVAMDPAGVKTGGAVTASQYAMIGDRTSNRLTEELAAAERKGKWDLVDSLTQKLEDYEFGKVNLASKSSEQMDKVLDGLGVLRDAYKYDGPSLQELKRFYPPSEALQMYRSSVNEHLAKTGQQASSSYFNKLLDSYQTAFTNRLSSEIPEGANVMPLMVRPGKLVEKDFAGSAYRDETFSDVIQRGFASGNDAVALRNTFDPGVTSGPFGSSPQMIDVMAIRDPARIRSRFAAFDPARINENDLLGRADPRLLALIGLGAGGAAYYGKDK